MIEGGIILLLLYLARGAAPAPAPAPAAELELVGLCKRDASVPGGWRCVDENGLPISREEYLRRQGAVVSTPASTSTSADVDESYDLSDPLHQYPWQAEVR